MRARNGLLILLIRCLLAVSAALAQEDCEEAASEARLCAEERRHLSQQLSDTRSEIEGLQHTIKGLESELQDQQHECREALSGSQNECSTKIEDLDVKLQAAKQQLRDSIGRISDITADLDNANRLRSQLEEDRKRCDSMAQQEQAQYNQHILDLQQQLRNAEAAREQSEKDVSSSVSAVREEAAKLRIDLDQERIKCEEASSRIQAEHDGQIQTIRHQLQATEADHERAKRDSETLTIELQSCQASLSQELQVRKQAEAQAALQENLHTKVSSDFKQKEQELVNRSYDMKAEIERLKSKISEMGEQLDFAGKAYLPLWSIPYYDEAVKHAAATKEQAMIYYEREIATGKAFRETKQTVMDASDRFMTMAEPHVSKAKVALNPMLASVMAKLKYAWEAISKHLPEDKYRALMQSAQHVQGFLMESWLKAKDYVAGIYGSDMVEQAMNDLTRIYTLLLGAHVAGSGIDSSIPAMMARYTLFAAPLLLLLPVLLMCCSRPRAKQQPPNLQNPELSL